MWTPKSNHKPSLPKFASLIVQHSLSPLTKASSLESGVRAYIHLAANITHTTARLVLHKHLSIISYIITEYPQTSALCQQLHGNLIQKKC